MNNFSYLCTYKIDAIVAQLVELWLPKPKVAGSSPVYRSRYWIRTRINPESWHRLSGFAIVVMITCYFFLLM